MKTNFINFFHVDWNCIFSNNFFYHFNVSIRIDLTFDPQMDISLSDTRSHPCVNELSYTFRVKNNQIRRNFHADFVLKSSMFFFQFPPAHIRHIGRIFHVKLSWRGFNWSYQEKGWYSIMESNGIIENLNWFSKTSLMKCFFFLTGDLLILHEAAVFHWISPYFSSKSDDISTQKFVL